MKKWGSIFFGLAVIIGCLGDSGVSNTIGCFPNACGTKGEYCSTPSLEIWNNYCKSSGLIRTSASGEYSGACFHEAVRRDPFYLHYGVILIDESNNNFHFGGEFAFFSQMNPYKELDLEQAKIKMSWFYSQDHQIEWKTDHAHVLLNREMEP